MLKFFKFTLTIFCLLAAHQHSKAQYVPINENFRYNLFVDGYGSCFVNDMLDTTCALVVNGTEVNLNSTVDSINGIEYFDNLQELYFGNGHTVSYIPLFNKTLKRILFNHAYRGDTLPPLPDSLEVFRINAIDSHLYIPALPPTLKDLEFIAPTDNFFLASFPSQLEKLNLGLAIFNNIPPLPATLKELLLYKTPIVTELPTLPDSLNFLEVYELPIGALPKLPASLRYLWLNNNQLLTCMPLLPDSLLELNLTGTPVTCLPNIPSNLGFTYESDIDSMQLCNGANGLICDSTLLCDPTDVMAIAVVKLTPLFPGDLTEIFVGAGNSCANGISGKVQVIINGPVTYQAPLPFALTPDVDGDTLTYTIPDFGNLSPFTAIQFTVLTDTIGIGVHGSVRFRVIVTPDGGDSNPGNNSISQWMDIQNSYDPNVKEVSPLSALPVQDDAHELRYTIHFQNTGTAPARNIVIRDTLDALLDTATFKVLAQSHGLQTFIDGNALRFVFPNINLPDSNTNEKQSHGYLQYSIKSKPMLQAGSTIHNTASIYFDFNPPIVTNTTENTVLDLTTSISYTDKPFEFNIYPNPANDNITLQWQGQATTATVYNLLGAKEMDLVIKTGNTQANVQHLAAGIYYVVVSANDTSVTKRFVKY